MKSSSGFQGLIATTNTWSGFAQTVAALALLREMRIHFD
jgi:hypothetical protein